MTLNCSPDINGYWEINELKKKNFDPVEFQDDNIETKTKRKLISKKRHEMTKKHFFTPCERFVGLEVDDEDAYQFFRVSDGSFLGSLQRRHIKVVQDNKGGCSMIIGVIDLRGRVFYEWDLKTLVHLSTESIILTKHDTNTVKFNIKKLVQSIQQTTILGLPMPSLYTYCCNMVLSKDFKEDYSNEEQLDYLKTLNNYTTFDSYQNLIHLLGFENKPEFLHYILNYAPLRYFICARSPLEISKSQCVDEIMQFLTSFEEEYRG
jgi:hypothetical protein